MSGGRSVVQLTGRGRAPSTEMTADDVAASVGALEAAGVTVWIDRSATPLSASCSSKDHDEIRALHERFGVDAPRGYVWPRAPEH
jgi:hypothetical protein